MFLNIATKPVTSLLSNLLTPAPVAVTPVKDEPAKERGDLFDFSTQAVAKASATVETAAAQTAAATVQTVTQPEAVAPVQQPVVAVAAVVVPNAQPQSQTQPVSQPQPEPVVQRVVPVVSHDTPEIDLTDEERARALAISANQRERLLGLIAEVRSSVQDTQPKAGQETADAPAAKKVELRA
ncbi:hypothetical protein [Paracoccus shanxieyensis]|uniref:Uncharacterized protein n=1 Tax=Paracoccus shanxieyensis TaxID=2675752 RepID=A0A6L6IYE0_9RHOB|nr:hypothetical protein [Paracoccus shanxieyensis]MTH65263.1 hypothetical protein [Paracoccus shanxieyensis]MTH88433.1 hypothetical protein [Paracoccus shanxieyensis]